MNTLYLVQDELALQPLRAQWLRMEDRLLPYMEHLHRNYAAQDFPNTLVLTDMYTATHGISSIPVPAYTNDHRIVFTPDVQSWKDIYLHQLDGYNENAVCDLYTHYTTRLNENHVLQILGHELAHHSELFLTDEDYETGVWFEEGMAEYLSRAYFLTEDEFATERRVNQELVRLFQQKHGWHSLEDFGQKTYEGNYASIFYEYWRSFLAVDALVQRYGSIQAVFNDYQRWHDNVIDHSLAEWFHIDI